MAERLLEDPLLGGRILGLLELAAQLGARGLGLEQPRQLLERQAQQVAKADDLADALDVGLGVEAMLPWARSAAPGSNPISS